MPISESTKIPSVMGMRHKAAMGVTEQYDCLVITVSEQKWQYYSFENGIMKTNLNINTLKETVFKIFPLLNENVK